MATPEMNLITLKNLCFPSEEDPESGEQLPFYRKQLFVISASAAGSLALIAASVYLLIPSGTKGPSTPGTEAPTTPKPTDPLPTPTGKPNQSLKPNFLQEIQLGKKLKQTETRSTNITDRDNILKQIKAKPKLREVQEKERQKAVLSAETKKPLDFVSELSLRLKSRAKGETAEERVTETPSSSAVVHSQPTPQSLSKSLTSRCKPISSRTKFLSTPIPVHTPPTKPHPTTKSSPISISKLTLLPFPDKKVPVASELPSGKPVKDKDTQLTPAVTEDVIEVAKVVPVPEKPINKAMLSAISARRKDYEDEGIKVVSVVTKDLVTETRPSEETLDASVETPIVNIDRIDTIDEIVESVGSLFQTRSVAPASAPLPKRAHHLPKTSSEQVATVELQTALGTILKNMVVTESDAVSDDSDSDSDNDLFKTVISAPTKKAVESKSAPLIDRSLAESATTNSMLAKIRASTTDKKNLRTEATAEDSDNDWD